MKHFLFTVSILFIIVQASYCQLPFRETISPLLDSLDVAYKYNEEKGLFDVNYCENFECVNLFILNNFFSDKATTGFLTIGAYVHFLKDVNTPSVSLLKKMNELNTSCNIGHLVAEPINDGLLIYYKNNIWFNDQMQTANFYKNLFLAYMYGDKFKKELAVYTEY